jgi:hypothetical protein
MPKAKQGSAIYRPDLGQAVLEYVEQAMMGYVGMKVMPPFLTGEQAASYPVIPKEVLLKIEDTDRAPRGNYPRGSWEYERGQFQTYDRGWEELVDDSERALIDQEAPGMADMVATQRAMNYVMRGQEKRVADILFNATNFTANSLTNEWDDATNATPIDDVQTGLKAFRLASGMMPDALVCNFDVYTNIKNTDQVVDRLKYTFPGQDIANMIPRQVATVLGIPDLWVAGAVYDSAGEGLDASVAHIWSNEYAALVKANSSRDITQPGVGRTFVWSADSPANPVVEQYRDEGKRSDVFRVRHHVGEILTQSKNSSGTVVSNVAAACVYLWDNVTT